jgi:hypothetical protein
MAILEPPLVAPELLLDPVRCLVEGCMRVGGAGAALENDALGNMGDDVASEAVIIGDPCRT